MIALIGSTHWDVIARGAFPQEGGVAVGQVTHEGPAGGTINTASHLRSRRPLLISQSPTDPDPGYVDLVAEMEVVAAPVKALNQATIVIGPDGERSVFLARRASAWPKAPARLADATVIDWHWTAPTELLSDYAPLMRGRIVCSVRSVGTLREHGLTPWAIVDSVKDVSVPEDTWLSDSRCAWCVMTDGAAGGRYWSAEIWRSFPAVLTNVVDVTGCGDAFRAGLLDALDDEVEIEEAVQRGASYGAEAARHAGPNRWLRAVDSTTA